MILPISSLQTKIINNKKNNLDYAEQKSNYDDLSKRSTNPKSQTSFKGRLFSTHYFIIPYSDAEANAREAQILADRQTRENALETRRNNLQTQVIDETRKNTVILDSISFANGVNELNNQIKTEFSEKVKLERQGLYNKGIPNCIMIEDPYDDVSKKLVVLTAKSSGCNFVDLNDENRDSLLDNLWETLKKSKEHFESTRERTLIYVKDFDKLITKGQNSFENIESLKDIMTRCASDFSSTIIFRTKDASKLVSEAIQSQRVGVKILVKFKSIK